MGMYKYSPPISVSYLFPSKQNHHQHSNKINMLFTTTVLASLAALGSAQTLNIPSRSGSIISLSSPSVISGSVDYGNKEFDRGRSCNTDADTSSANAVFILNDGASISNVIIGANQLEGIHCKGACTLRNVWFRDVCEGTHDLPCGHQASNVTLTLTLPQMLSPPSAPATFSGRAAVPTPP